LSVTCGRSVVYSGFLHQQNWSPQYNWNIVESGVKHPNPNKSRYHTLPDEGYSNPNKSRYHTLPDEGYSNPNKSRYHTLPDEGYSNPNMSRYHTLPDEGYSNPNKSRYHTFPDEDYSRNVLCTLNLISTLLLFLFLTIIKKLCSTVFILILYLHLIIKTWHTGNRNHKCNSDPSKINLNVKLNCKIKLLSKTNGVKS
jgi:hypothetical protein